MSTQLATKEIPVLDQIRENPIQVIKTQFNQLSQVANVTFPMTAIDNLPPMHKPSPTMIFVNTAKESKDTYYITSEQRGLSKHVILRMLNAAGANYETKKVTSASDINNIRYTARVWGKLPDGTMHQSTGAKSWSWEKCQEDFIRKAVDKPKDGETAERAKMRGIKGALQYREFADEQTETKAILRAARAFLTIQTSYTPKELEKPFLMLRSVPDLDLNDRDIKMMIASRALDSMQSIYGDPVPAQLPSRLDNPAMDNIEEYDDEEASNDAIDAESQEVDSDYDPLAEPITESKEDPAGPPPCTDCGCEIKAVTLKDKSYTISEVVDLTVAKFEKPLCFSCSAKQPKKVA